MKNKKMYLDEKLRKEFGSNLLLDWMIQFDKLAEEKISIGKKIENYKNKIKNLKKSFFLSEQDEQNLYELKSDLLELERADDSICDEMKDVEKRRLHISLSSKDEEKLEPLLKHMEKKSWIAVGDDNYYKITKIGNDVYNQLIEQQDSYKSYFELFAYVDLEKGVFADPQNDLLEGDRWTDLRVAVSIQLGVDPFRVVFLSLLAEGFWFENKDWKFDLGLGSLFNELEILINDQITLDELSYSDENGFVSGEDVIKDVIDQGNSLQKNFKKL